MTTSKTPRWMKSALTEAAKAPVVMPWARGPRRAEMIARREATRQPRLTLVKRAG